MKRISNRTLITAFLMPIVLAGCGGEETEDSGGSGSGTGGASSTSLPFTTNPTLLASFFDSLDTFRTAANRLITEDARYLLQDAPDGYYADINDNGTYEPGVDVLLKSSPLKHAGVHYAHAAGLTGDGEVIAISDNGFLPSHEVFDGKSVTTGFGISVADHGTFVASIAAGNSADMIGVAPEADLILGSYSTFSQLSDTADTAALLGAVALNNSWGFVGLDADSIGYNSVFSLSSGAGYLSSLKNYARDGIVIFAVPNDYDLATISLMPGLPILEPDLEESWLAIVNGVPVMENDDIVSAQRISGACLEAAAWCMAADGSWTGATSSADDSYAFGTGTSFASPTVAGALALLAEAFPGMTHQELRIRLLASADNEFTGFTKSGSTELVPGFEHDYSTEWGHGFLDVAAALMPIGQSMVTTGNGSVLNPEEPLVVTGGASGDAVSQALSDVNIISRDALSATFSINAASLVATRPATPLFTNRDLATFSAAQDTNSSAAAFFDNGQDIAFDWGDSGYSFAFYQGTDGGADTFGFGMRRSYSFDGASLELSAAFGDDTASLLSNWSGGTDTTITSAGMALTADLPNEAAMTFEIGYASGQENSGLGQSANVLMNSAALSVSRRNAFARDDHFRLSLALPAAVTQGSTSLALPVYADGDAVTYADIPIDLAPEKREVRLSLDYERPLSRGATMGISLAHAHNRGNVAGQRETGLMVKFAKRF